MEAHFELERAILVDEPFAPPLHNPKLIPLAEAWASHQLTADTACLVANWDEHVLVLGLLPLVYYHTVQGLVEGQAWMVSFCLICNAGSCFSPLVEEQHYHFTANGIYNGMSLLKDQETGSWWHHLTGKCLSGEAKETQLPLLTTLHHLNGAQTLETYPQALWVETPLSPKGEKTARRWDTIRQDPHLEFADPASEATLGAEDTRLPRLEAGLGVIGTHLARFYPLRVLHAHDNWVINRFGEQNLLVYIAPQTGDPHACYIEAESAIWRDDILQLANGDYIDGVSLYDAQGKRKSLQQPLQHFQRWYSFAFTYPQGEIFHAEEVRR